ncbi:MAG: AAA family ATPase, partial [Deltaproteobacteria bacterium]|nr:AAA family ATPase [Deltaproteobacteria bacterium]
LASRMQAIAPTGSIAITEQTRPLVEGFFQVKSLGLSRVKGLAEPINVYEVTGPGPLRTRLQRAAGRGLTRFVGRHREMEALRHAAEMARGGHGQIVAVMAEPGLGKSRLFYEFKASSTSGWMMLEAYSVSYGKASTYLPVIDLLRNYFDIAAGDNERKRREKVTGKIVTLDRSLEDTVPYLFSLLGIVEGDDPIGQMDGQLKKRRTLDALKRILLRESLNQPLIVMFEDLHWIDEQTQEFLNLLADSLANARILLLVNYRPEYSHQWNSKTYYMQLRLDPLGGETAEEMLDALLLRPLARSTLSLSRNDGGRGEVRVAGEGESGDNAAREGVDALKRVIIERTEGNPFFMEETMQVLLDEGVLVRNGAMHLTKPIGELKIPHTVQAILASRIDRLAADAKDLMQTLSVIGREFPISLVRAVVSKPAEVLDRLLNHLQLAEFIYEQPRAGDVEYTFKHALTHEVAYDSLLLERRRELHERIAQAIEALFAQNLADHYEDLARHYRRSGNSLKAATFLRLTAQQAMNRSAYSEANTLLTTALEMLQMKTADAERDRAQVAVRLSLAICLMYGSPGSREVATQSVTDTLERARDLCEKLGDDVARFEVLDALVFHHYSVQGNYKKARTIGAELLKIAASLADPAMEGRARSNLAYGSLHGGEFSIALNQCQRARNLSEGIPSKQEITVINWRISPLNYASWCWWMLGYPERAIAISAEAIAFARRVFGDRVGDLCLALFWAAGLNVFLGNWKIARSHAEEALDLTHEHGWTSLSAWPGLFHGWAFCKMGEWEEGLREMLWCQPTLQQAQWVIAPHGLADVYLQQDRQRDGLEAVAGAFELSRNMGNAINNAELLRLKGELLLLSGYGAAKEAAECFRNALGIARCQSAKSWELRATTSLARLLRDTNRRDEARMMLAEIYNWFTEGFDTADLKDAKALLDELKTI